MEKIKIIRFTGGASRDLIVEQVVLKRDEVMGDEYGFNVYDRLNDKLTAENIIIGPDNERYMPIEKPPWLVPDVIENLEVDENSLYNEIINFLAAHLDLIDEAQYHVLACFILASWRWEEFEAAPYLFFLGPLASGKTKALECLYLLCYRAINAASITAPAIFRAIEAWHPTLLLDETEIYASDAAAEVRAVLNAGYRRESKAVRIEKADERPTLATFNVFSFKALAGTKELMSTLMSRCIPIVMEKNTREIKLFLDKEWAAKLRQNLLKYRMKNLGKFAKAENEIHEVKDGRLVELFYPLITVAPESVKNKLIDYAKTLYAQRLEEEKASLEAMVFEAIAKIREENKEEKMIQIRRITDLVNFNLPVNEQLKNCQVGRVAAGLGFKKARDKEGKRVVVWDDRLAKRLYRRYLPDKLDGFNDGFVGLSVLSVGSGKELSISIDNVVNNNIVNSDGLKNLNQKIEAAISKVTDKTDKPTKINIYPLREGEEAVCMFCEEKAKFRIVGEKPWQVEYLCFKHKLEMEEALEKGEKK